MRSEPEISVKKFDLSRAAEYETQSRIALAGYQACHELSACLLCSALPASLGAQILAAGAGGGAQEVICAAALRPEWRFTVVDPSPPMMELTVSRISKAGLAGRTDFVTDVVEALPSKPTFDAATLIGVLHHLPGFESKRTILSSIARRLKHAAPLVLACNRGAYSEQPVFLGAWRERWRMHGAGPQEINDKLQKILQGADPPASDAAVAELLEQAGFERPLQFFSSLFWGSWIAFRKAD